MTVSTDRRSFLRAIAAAGATSLFDALFAQLAEADIWPNGTTPYGPLLPNAPVDGGPKLLALPPGFRYRVLSEAGRPMSDGVPTPKCPDGMAAFDAGGYIRLIRNHELKNVGPALAGPLDSYDPRATGGVTTLLVDPVTRTLVRDFVSLSGTIWNCNGGVTPWNTWISGEESTAGKAQGFEREHGYCFEVHAGSDRASPPEPLVAMGRFVHEAVVTDPATSITYMTEDEGAGGFYRFLPNVPGQFQKGGTLQILAIVGVPFYDTARGQTPGTRLAAGWITIEEPNPVIRSSTDQGVYEQGRLAGAAKFRRLEGAAFQGGSIYFASNTGGDARLGQIWRYTPDRGAPLARRRSAGRKATPPREGELTLIYESADAAKLQTPDSICVSKRGALLLCEDSGSGGQYLRCLTPSGEIFEFARNITPGNEHSELAGVTFSPDGETMFLNIYVGYTIAIWGPWHLGAI